MLDSVVIEVWFYPCALSENKHKVQIIKESSLKYSYYCYVEQSAGADRQRQTDRRLFPNYVDIRRLCQWLHTPACVHTAGDTGTDRHVLTTTSQQPERESKGHCYKHKWLLCLILQAQMATKVTVSWRHTMNKSLPLAKQTTPGVVTIYSTQKLTSWWSGPQWLKRASQTWLSYVGCQDHQGSLPGVGSR